MENNTQIIATMIYPLQIIEERLSHNELNSRIVPVETESSEVTLCSSMIFGELNEPITAIEIHAIHPIHSLYSVASDYIDIEHNMTPQELSVLEPPKQKCCHCYDCCTLSPDEVFTRYNFCKCCIIIVICLGLTLFFVSIVNK